MGIEPLPVNKAPAAKDFASEMEGVLESMRKNLEKVKEWMKLNADKHHSAVPDYTIGQQVWLATKNLFSYPVKPCKMHHNDTHSNHAI